MISFDAYAILGVPFHADEDAIKSAYRAAAKRWHPDRNPNDKAHAEIMFKDVVKAWDILSDPQKRVKYDEEYETARMQQMSVHDVFSRQEVHHPRKTPRVPTCAEILNPAAMRDFVRYATAYFGVNPQ